MNPAFLRLMKCGDWLTNRGCALNNHDYQDQECDDEQRQEQDERPDDDIDDDWTP